MQDITIANVEDLTHQASNEALSIVMGVQMLSTLQESSLSPRQLRAMKILEESAARLVDIIDALKATDPTTCGVAE